MRVKLLKGIKIIVAKLLKPGFSLDLVSYCY